MKPPPGLVQLGRVVFHYVFIADREECHFMISL